LDACVMVLPDYPPVMRLEMAAAYLSLSQSSFKKHVAPEVQAVRLTPGCVGWLRSELDKWLAGRSNVAVSDWNGL
jgi:predicted DNA-binding transcriptional regulator AlpA